ncbi:Hsp20/alpha crystallin family protein [Asanoa sp. NPDC049573]|uniref:Hsp20/alpha crystallin family protein n=1 Tax=Asanoa sp. NPDC049573 TaxID=3155396 RepID=UPI003428A381
MLPDRYVLRAALPGIDPTVDLRVTCSGNELRLDAVRAFPPDARGGHSEFSYGRLFRVVPLPVGTRARTISARYVDGILEVSARLGVAEPGTRQFTVPVGDHLSSDPQSGDLGP